jgi:hypothetical protein
MHFGRSDTYINVYLPREDGDDPRRYARPSSPVHCSGEIYKFSDEIVKDRKLFLGKKQMSLYEIYYKDNKECDDNSIDLSDTSDYEEENDGFDIRKRNVNYSKDKNTDHFEFPRVSKLSISLDNRLRRAQRSNMSRFNEPMQSYGKQKQSANNGYDPNQSLERQVTSYDYMRIANRRNVTSESIRNRQKTQTISKIFKKAHSATSDYRHVRSLGLPPISRSNTALTSLLPEINPGRSRAPTASRVRPLRPSSKPHRIWQQTNNVLMNGFESSTAMEPGIKQLKLASSRSRHNVNTASDIFV